MYKWAGEKLVLASASPRRREMLSGCGIPFDVVPSNCDESVLLNEDACDMVKRLSVLKARSIASNFGDRLVLGADTTVVVDGEILGKPETRDDAARMLGLIQGRTHEVVGGFSLVNLNRKVEVVNISRSLVTVRALSKGEIASYIDTGEPMDKAGSYAIQGIGASLVEEVKGSYTNVVGLDLTAVLKELILLGYVTIG